MDTDVTLDTKFSLDSDLDSDTDEPGNLGKYSSVSRTKHSPRFVLSPSRVMVIVQTIPGFIQFLTWSILDREGKV